MKTFTARLLAFLALTFLGGLALTCAGVDSLLAFILAALLTGLLVLGEADFNAFCDGVRNRR